MRPEGFYWVKMSEDSIWEVAQWHHMNSGTWFLVSLDREFKDWDLFKIKENRLEEPKDA